MLKNHGEKVKVTVSSSWIMCCLLEIEFYIRRLDAVLSLLGSSLTHIRSSLKHADVILIPELHITVLCSKTSEKCISTSLTSSFAGGCIVAYGFIHSVLAL